MEKIKALLAELRKEEIKIVLNEGKLDILSFKNQIKPAQIQKIKASKLEIIDYLKYVDDNKIKYSPIPQIKASLEGYPLSSAQTRLWYISQIEESSVAYNMPGTIVLDGAYNINYFQKAIHAVIDRHEILRTVFRLDETGEPRQYILTSQELDFSVDYKDFSKDENPVKSANAFTDSDTYKPFDLVRGPLLRACLLQLSNDRYVFYYNMHHIIGDGLSMNVLTKDVMAFYQGYSSGKAPAIPSLRIQYKDYAAWQQEQLSSPQFKEHKAFWHDQLEGDVPVINLPTEKKRPQTKTYNGRSVAIHFSSDIKSKLQDFTSARGGSLFLGLLSIFKILLYRYTGEKDIIIGTPVSRREHPDLENQIGFYINTLVLRNEINPTDSFVSFFDQIKENTFKTFKHQMFPFDEIVNSLDVKWNPGRSVLFDILFNYNSIAENGLIFDDQNQTKDLGESLVKFDIQIDIQNLEEGIDFVFGYNNDVYEQSMVERLLIHYKRLVIILLENPSLSINEVTFLSEKEIDLALKESNTNQVIYPKDKTVISLFEEQVKASPDNVALAMGKETLTYKELDERSNQLAHYLRKQGVKEETLVPICIERSFEMIIGILGIQKSGGAYVPIDPGYPHERISYILKDTGSGIILSSERSKEAVAHAKNLTIISLDGERELIKEEPVARCENIISTNQLAYIIYTSGSTGQPKGVMIEHRSVVNHILHHKDEFKIDASDNILSFANFVFDASVEQIYLALVSGGTLVLTTKLALLDQDLFKKVLDENKVTHLHATPSFLVSLPFDNYKFLRRVISGGESCSTRLAELWGSQYDFYNEYGPTETTVTSAEYKYEPTNTYFSEQPIGLPIANTQLYLLDENLNIVPSGVIGELYIGGAGLARGYLNKSKLTAEKFINHPFVPKEKLYKTGDLVRRLSSGHLLFEGRKDFQVKIRGYRIELGEIESAFAQINGLDQAVVLAKEDQNGSKELVAYIVCEKELNRTVIRQFLEGKLPAYMVPKILIFIDKIPLTPNGKIDRKALPNPKELDLSTSIEYVAPRTETEKELVAIWESVLDRTRIGVKDDFLDLGGHSLKAIKLINEIHKIFGVKLSITDLFSNSLLLSIAELITNKQRDIQNVEAYKEIPKTKEQEFYPLSSSQMRLWILSQFDEVSIAYNMPSSFELEGDSGISYLKKAIHAVIERHEILRTVFKPDAEGNIRQWIIPYEQFEFECQFYNLSNDPNAHQIVQEKIAEDSYQYFDFENGPLIRIAFFQIEEKRHVFYYNMHHIISDGLSMDVLSRDVLAYYNHFKKKTTLGLPELRIQYKDYTTWQLAQLESKSSEEQKNYWLDKLSGELPTLNLPSTKQRPIIRTNRGRFLTTYLSKESTKAIKYYVKANGGTLFMFLLAALKVSFYRYTKQEDIIVGSPISGRPHANLEDQIGFYVNTLVLRDTINGEMSFETCYQNVKQNLLEAYKYQMYPFDRLVEDLEVKRDTSRSALFDVLVTFQHPENYSIAVPQKDLEEIKDQGEAMSKFDLSINFTEAEDNVKIALDYNTDVYDYEEIERVLKYYQRLVSDLTKKSQQPLRNVLHLTEAEKEELLKFNATDKKYPLDHSILELLSQRAKEDPLRTAVSYQEKSLSYEELDTQSNQLAHYLKNNCGVESQDFVAIQLERSEWMLLSILGVLKTGAAYIPLDMEYPKERISYIKKDSNYKVAIDEAFINTFKGKMSSGSNLSLEIEIPDTNTAYGIYTSGSTGNPKGVLNGHAGLYNHMIWMRDELGVSEKDIILQKTPYIFDVSIWELLMPCISGCELVFAKPNGHKDAAYLQDLIQQKQVSMIHFVPSMLNVFLAALDPNTCKSLRHVVCSGEALPGNLVEELKEKLPWVRIHNLYGPTEAAIHVSSIDLTEVDTSKVGVSIGKPVANTKMYVVDEYLNEQAIGVPGELLIEGVQVAQGYLNRSDLTKEKFIPSPFTKGAKLYRTGDLVKWLPNGEIFYITRIDNQVKIRGNRIELGEIESVLSLKEEINKSVVVVKASGSDKHLVAYYTSLESISVSELRSFLQSRLPIYMIPNYYVHLAEIPLTSSGKVNRKALPDLNSLNLTSDTEYVAPRTDVEKKLVTIWEAVLERKKVGAEDDFLDLGGHSLKAIQLINRYHQAFNVKVSITEIFTYTLLCDLAELISNKQRDVQNVEAYKDISKTKEQESYPLSSSQMRLWILSQFDEVSIAYNMPSSFELNGDFDVSYLNKAIHAVIERHEILRTVFKPDAEGNIRQWIIPYKEFEFECQFHNLSNSPDARLIAQQKIAEDRYQYFDFENGPLIRVAFFQVEEKRHVFYFNMHHVISDGWSMNILSRDVLAYYKHFKTKTTLELPELKIQYKDYTIWQLDQLKTKDSEKHKAFWMDKLSGDLPKLNLPSTKQRPLLKTNNGRLLQSYIGTQDTAQIRKYIRENGGTLFTFLSSTLKVLLHKYSGQKDIIVGSPIAGRGHAYLEDQIGFYVNTLALRSKIESTMSFDDFYQQVKQDFLDTYAHQMYPFDQLVDDLNLRRDTSRNAIFDVMLVLQNTGSKEEGELLQNSTSTIKDLGEVKSMFDLILSFTEQGDGLLIGLNYNVDVYDYNMIERFLTHYLQFVKNVVSGSNTTIGELECLTESERSKLLYGFNNTTIPYPKDKTLISLFEEQVTKTPDNIAIVFEGKELTYLELNECSNQLAYYLKSKYELIPDDLVAIKLDRSEWVIVSILATLKGGAAYVPIDSKYPQQRIDYMLSDSNCKLLIDEKELTLFRENRDQYDRANLNSVIKSDHLAYVIYTSGSTGKSKGVAVGHSSIANSILSQIDIFSTRTCENSLQFASFSFDASISEIFYTLLAGSTLHVLADGTRSDVELFEKYLVEHKIEIGLIPPALLKLLNINCFKHFKTLITGGEAAVYDKVSEYLERDYGVFFNAYGPTEASVMVTTLKIENSSQLKFSNIPIGKPIGNTQLYILDDYLKPCPIGVSGELYISGSNLMRGYLNRPDLTLAKLIPNPFVEGEFMYKSGDVVKCLEDGNIMFMGRADDQVKISGYRIELMEIESVLLSKKEIEHATVLVKESGQDKYLVAYYTSLNDVSVVEIRSFLQTRLPVFMIPNYFVPLDKFPLTSNGKIDKKALPDLDGLELSSEMQYEGPRNKEEETLVAIWEAVLKRNEISIHDNFYDLGGDSLRMINLASAIKKAFKVKFPITQIMDSPTIESFAYFLQNKNTQSNTQFKEIVLIREHANTDLNLFFVHDGSGDIQGYIELTKSLRGYNCWGLRSGLLNHVGPINTSLEEIAERHISLLKQKQATGPYNFVGWSSGGIVAFEMIRQLELGGDKVNFLIAVDSQMLRIRNQAMSAIQNLFSLETESTLMKRFWNKNLDTTKYKTISELWNYAIEHFGQQDLGILKSNISPGFQKLIPHFDELEINQLSAYLNAVRSLEQAIDDYQSDYKLDASLLYLKAEASDFSIDNLNDLSRNKTQKYTLEGDHFSIFKKPRLTVLAKIINDYLDVIKVSESPSYIADFVSQNLEDNSK